MIFHDKESHLDTSSYPTERPNKLCVNCQKNWIDHDGWYCQWLGSTRRKFEVTQLQEMYLVPSMVKSLSCAEILKYGLTIAQITASYPPFLVTVPLTGFKIIRDKIKDKETNCPCGIIRSRCDYHK